MTTKPEWERLAEWLDDLFDADGEPKAAAAELRRLHAENETLRKDAERYRFIRDADRSDCITPELALYAMESLDAYVDAAMDDEAAIAKATGENR